MRNTMKMVLESLITKYTAEEQTSVAELTNILDTTDRVNEPVSRADDLVKKASYAVVKRQCVEALIARYEENQTS